MKAESDNAHKRYGMGFYVSKKWTSRLQGYKQLTGRITEITFRVHRKGKKLLTILNVYGPTSATAKRHDTTAVETYYNPVQEYTTIYQRKAAIFMVAGDFNSKVGQRTDEDRDIMGKVIMHWWS